MSKAKRRAVRILAAAVFVLMIGANILAEALPINGVTTREVSERFSNLLMPAPYAFAIWGAIYLLLAALSAFLLGAFHGGERETNPELFDRIAALFAVSSLANGVWIVLWHYYAVAPCMLAMCALLFSLLFMTGEIEQQPLTKRERFFVRLPLSAYFGWITVAAILNATALFVGLGATAAGALAQVWTVAVLIGAALLGTAVILRRRDAAYGLVLLWAYAAILARHASPGGLSCRYPAVIAVCVACLALLAIVCGAALLLKRRDA